MMKFKSNARVFLVSRLLAVVALFWVSHAFAGFQEEPEVKPWQELEVALPPFPKKENLLPFYVSAASEHRFFLDSESLTVGSDGVVRFTLVVQTSGGAVNTSYEGMRCQTRERRPYAFGRADGTWSRARGGHWFKVREEDVSRQYAALFTDFFCPGGVIVRNQAEARRSLRQSEIR